MMFYTPLWKEGPSLTVPWRVEGPNLGSSGQVYYGLHFPPRQELHMKRVKLKDILG